MGSSQGVSYGDCLSAQGTPLPLVHVPLLLHKFSSLSLHVRMLRQSWLEPTPRALLSIVWGWHTHTGIRWR